jgi:hypothetical protein
MQTLSIPYTVDENGQRQIDELRRIQSAAIRTAYVNARAADGSKVKEKDLRHFVKARFTGTVCDAWLLHCATLEGMAKRDAHPDGNIVFGGKSTLRRLANKLIDKETWQRRRLHPLVSIGDKNYGGNRHFRLSADGLTCRLSVYKKPITLHLATLRGKWQTILSQVAQAAAAKQLNVTFKLDDHKLHVTFDPKRLPAHPEARKPLALKKRRVLGIDTNPNWIGVSVIEVSPDGSDDVKVLDWRLIDLRKINDTDYDKAKYEVSKLSDAIVALARHWRVSVIAQEELTMRGRDHGLGAAQNRLRNTKWQRNFLQANVARKAALAGMEVHFVWAAYSSTIGNIRHDLPDAVAASAEIARRGYFYKQRDRSFPSFDVSGLLKLWKQEVDLNGVEDWKALHGKLKQANVRVRRPHPVVATRAMRGGRFMSTMSAVRLWRPRPRRCDPSSEIGYGLNQ